LGGAAVRLRGRDDRINRERDSSMHLSRLHGKGPRSSPTIAPPWARPSPPPAPPRVPLVGSLLAFRRDPLGFLLRTAAAYGDVVHYRFGRAPVFLLKHPDHIKDVLVTHQHRFIKGRGIQWAKLFLGEGLLTSEGEFHTRQRRLSQPAFHRQRIGAYAAIMADYAARARERWRDGMALAFEAEMHALTLAMGGRTLFCEDMADEAGEIRAALTD